MKNFILGIGVGVVLCMLIASPFAYYYLMGERENIVIELEPIVMEWEYPEPTLTGTYFITVKDNKWTVNTFRHRDVECYMMSGGRLSCLDRGASRR